MRFPRGIKPFRGQLEMAPFLGVFFLLAVLLLFSSTLVFTPGVPIHLPETVELPGTSNPTVSVAVDADGRFYIHNQISDEARLKERLQTAVDQSKQPLTLVIQADNEVKHGVLVRLELLARSVGLREILIATRPATIPMPAARPL
jgi:biopolymer transport protein ExbD